MSSLRSGIFLFLSIYCSTLFSDTLYVQNNAPNGPGSLRDRINMAMDGDSILFNVTGQITVDTQLIVNKNLFIIGPGPDQMTLSGNGLSRIMEIHEEDTVYLSQLTFKDGSAIDPSLPTGGAIFNLGVLTIEYCVFRDNAARYGGAISCGEFGTHTRLVLKNCTFAFNTATPDTLDPGGAPQAGGAVYMEGRFGSASTEATNCTFSNNRANYSGGAVFMYGGEDMPVSFTGFSCTIAHNQAEQSGGIGFETFSLIRMRNCILAQNTGNIPNYEGDLVSFGNNLIDDDSGIFFFPDDIPHPNDLINVDAKLLALGDNGSPFLTHPIACTSPAVDNANDGPAPGLDQRGISRVGLADIGAFELDPQVDLVVSHTGSFGKGSLPQVVQMSCPNDVINLGSLSGTIYLPNSLVLTHNLTIQGSAAQSIVLSGSDSLRIFHVSPDVQLTLSWLSLTDGNPALYGGGAIQNRGHLRLSHCSIYGNQAQAGGAIANYAQGGEAIVEATNCTFSGNEAHSLDGGAIDNRSFDFLARLDLKHCTLADNEAAFKGGGIYDDGAGIVRLKNTLLAHNQAESGADAYGSIQSDGNNLIGNTEFMSLSGGSNDLLNMSAGIDPLGAYGGPSLSHRLQSGSPAIDAGNESGILSFDQRGFARFYGNGTDIGAYEYDPATHHESLNALQGLSIYPNPNAGRFYIDIALEQDEALQIQVLNSIGQLVHQINENYGFGSHRIEVNLPNISTGTYLLRISSKSGMLSKQIMIF